MRIESYRKLIVWQKSIVLVREVYVLTKAFPREEIYGLTSQMRRAAVSSPSDIAEGSRRSSRKDFRNFLIIAFASGAELETQTEIAKMLGFCTSAGCAAAASLLDEVMRMLNTMIGKFGER